MQRKLLIIDGHNFLWKAFGVPFKFYSEKGTPLHVVTTFLSFLRRAVRAAAKSGNCGIAVVFDTEGANSNNQLLETYKTNRRAFTKNEDSPYSHIPHVIRVLKTLRIKTYARKGIEADDIIASLAARFLEGRQGHVFIASSDSDFYQLISGKVSQIVLGKKGAYEILTPMDIKRRVGISPQQYIYFKSLTGDPCDNIKGLPNVGPIRALKIMKKEMKFDLKPYAELLMRNRKLIGLNKSLQIFSMEAMTPKPEILDLKNQEIFQRIGF